MEPLISKAMVLVVSMFTTCFRPSKKVGFKTAFWNRR